MVKKMKNKYICKKIQNAYKVLNGEPLTETEAMELIQLQGTDTMDLYSLANKVKNKFSGNKMDTCQITNIRSGNCSEDCSFCAQSAHNSCDIDVYGLISTDEAVKRAFDAKRNGEHEFCLVASGYGYLDNDAELAKITDMVRAVKEKTGLEVHVSIGMLNDKTAAALKEAGVEVVNHNLETAPDFYSKICTTHTSQDRINTVKAVKSSGMKACCGGILGLGETEADRVKLACEIRKLKADFIPLNIHRKIEGTTVKESNISLREVLNTVALFRLLNPESVIKIAAGRETFLSDFQGLAFMAGANGMLIGGYLTTRGRSVENDRKMISSIESML